jgi:ferredoxin
MPPVLIRIERALCMAKMKNCVLIAPEVFAIDAENKAVVEDPAGADEGRILRAALACQQRAVIVTEDDGSPIWPGDFGGLLARLEQRGGT